MENKNPSETSVTEPPEIAVAEAACNPRQALFARAAVEYGNWTAAYRRAYNKWDAAGDWVHGEASKLMQRPEVSALHAVYLKWHRQRHAATIDGIIGKLQRVVDANPADLVQRRVGCCRHCHGVDFKYQRTKAEFDAAWAAYAAAIMTPRKPGQKDPTPPEDLGGIGFNRTREPNEACPECFGEGVGRTMITDTRKLSPDAAALYAGVKETKDGTQVLMLSQLEAADKILRKLGAYVERKEISGPGGAPLQAVALTTTDPVAAAKAYREIMENGGST